MSGHRPHGPMKPPTRTAYALCISTALVLGFAPSARGQPADATAKKVIEARYNDAAAEMEAGNFASACPKLESVTRMAPEGIGARITLAECYQRWGKLASAWAQYVAAQAMATRANQKDRARKSAARAAEIEPRLATLTIDVPSGLRGAEGLLVARDGTPLTEAQLGTPLPVDKGTHEITVTASGRQPWKTTVDIPADGARARVEVRAGPEAPEPASTQAASKPGLPPPAASSPPPPPKGSLWRIPVAAVAAGLGAAGIGVGVELRSLAIARFQESNRGHCNEQDLCDATGVALRSDALAHGNGATAAILAGSALAAAGIVLIMTDIDGLRAGLATTSFTVTAGGLSLKGSW